MSRTKPIVKLLPLAFMLMWCISPAFSGEKAPAKPHMMYFYNPSCRLCTRTNEVVGAAEEKYKERMSNQRFNISDPEHGMDNVLYMFELMDEMKVPEEDNITLVVFMGLLEQDGDEVFFTPERVLVEGDEIIGKLDDEARDFLDKAGKGGTLGASRPAAFFLPHGACVANPS